MSTKAKQKTTFTFAYALRSFVGHLEGTQKAAHTIKNYRLDILAFQNFLERGRGGKAIRLQQLTPDDIEHYHSFLKSGGLKTNTRRRKLMTVKKFLSYLAGRGKIPAELGKRFPTPHKIERIPFTVSSAALIAWIHALPAQTDFELRNRVLLRTLAETGCQVSEICKLRFSHFVGRELQIPGKNTRRMAVSSALADDVLLLQRNAKGDYLFLGFNKFGSLRAPISPRGVELLVKSLSVALRPPQADPTSVLKITPRTFRHSAVLHWHQEGASRVEIVRRLGLKTEYALRTFEPLFKSAKA